MTRTNETINFAVIARRKKIGELYLQGKLQIEIASMLGINQGSVSRHLKAILAAWRQATLQDFAFRRAEELAKLDHLEAEAWKSWRASKGNREETGERKEDASGKKLLTQIRSEQRTGDISYLRMVVWCIERRCKLLGLDAPSKIASSATPKPAKRIEIRDELSRR